MTQTEEGKTTYWNTKYYVQPIHMRIHFYQEEIKIDAAEQLKIIYYIN